VNHEDHISVVQIRFYPAPFFIRENCPKVVSHHAQIEPVPPIDLLLGIAQRCEQTRSYIENGDLHCRNFHTPIV